MLYAQGVARRRDGRRGRRGAFHDGVRVRPARRWTRGGETRGRHRRPQPPSANLINELERLQPTGDAEEQEPLLGALEQLQRLGAWPAADLVTRRLRELGVRRLPRRPRRATAANPAGLTARELEVLDLIGADLRNVDIAARLHISGTHQGRSTPRWPAESSPPTDPPTRR